jgi:HAD superfamily hydrolase (TIGR01484 family)
MPVNQPAEEPTRRGLRRLADAGAQLVFASGKPCVYLSGLVRGLGVMETALIGENGAETWVTSTMPPERLENGLAPEELAALQSLREAVAAQYGARVFFQPNAVGVTAFPVSEDLPPPDVAARVDVALPDSITMYIHVDSVDWAVKRFDKGVALRRLAEHLGVPLSRVAAVGDGANDLPMFDVAARALWLGDPTVVAGTPAVCVPTIHEALERLAGFVRG